MALSIVVPKSISHIQYKGQIRLYILATLIYLDYEIIGIPHTASINNLGLPSKWEDQNYQTYFFLLCRILWRALIRKMSVLKLAEVILTFLIAIFERCQKTGE